MMPRIKNGRRRRLGGASGRSLGTTTAGAAADAADALGAANTVGAADAVRTGDDPLLVCAAVSMSLFSLLVGFFWGDSVEIDALGARTGGRFEQQRERNDEQEGDAGQNEHPLEGQQRRLSVEHPVEDATGLLARRAR